MKRKNSNAILKDCFKYNAEFRPIYLDFKQKLKLHKNKTIAIAVSGGPDSLGLTALAKAYSYENICKIQYVLVNHNLRKNSSKEAEAVKKLLKKKNIHLNILSNKDLITKNIQSKARVIRYDLISAFCKKKNIKKVVTAHHLEDQVETFFIRLSRGSGLHGLSSMRTITKIGPNLHLVRPLLNVKKNQLIKIAKSIFGKFFKDPTNKDKKYLRTRIRKLKNILEKSGINYDRITQSINNLASSRDTLDVYLKDSYNSLIKKRNKKIIIKLDDFNSLNLEMKIRFTQKAIKDLTGSYYTQRTKKIVNLIRNIETNKNNKNSLGKCIILREKGLITLQKVKI